MLTRLRLNTFISRHDQHDCSNSASACEHVLHKTLVTGDVDKANADSIGKVKVSEAKVNGDATAFLLGQTIGIGPG